MAYHSNLTDPDIHEPKGISSAAAGTVYVANGAGSGRWLSTHSYGNLHIDVNSTANSVSLPAALDATFNTNTDYRKVNAAGMWQAGDASNITLSPSNGEIVITQAGAYNICFWTTYQIATASARKLAWKYAINGVLSTLKIIDTTDGAGNIYSISASAIIDNLSVGDKISIYAACSAAETLVITDANIYAVLVKAS
jgi:hypothetical protein